MGTAVQIVFKILSNSFSSLTQKRVSISTQTFFQETLDDIDKNGDGRISIDEYIGDMYHMTGDPENEPDWVNYFSKREHLYTELGIKSNGIQ